MGKAKRIKPSQVGNKVALDEDIQSAKFAKPKNRNKIRLRKEEHEEVSSHIFLFVVPLFYVIGMY